MKPPPRFGWNKNMSFPSSANIKPHQRSTFRFFLPATLQCLGETRDWLRVKVSLSDLLTLCGLAVRAVLGVWFLLALCARAGAVGAVGAALAVWGLTAKLPVLTVLRLAPRLLSRVAVDVVDVVGRPGGAVTVAGRPGGDDCRGRAGAAGLRLGLAARGADGARGFRAVRLPPGTGGQWGMKGCRVGGLNQHQIGSLPQG